MCVCVCVDGVPVCRVQPLVFVYMRACAQQRLAEINEVWKWFLTLDGDMEGQSCPKPFQVSTLATNFGKKRNINWTIYNGTSPTYNFSQSALCLAGFCHRCDWCSQPSQLGQKGPPFWINDQRFHKSLTIDKFCLVQNSVHIVQIVLPTTIIQTKENCSLHLKIHFQNETSTF